MKNSFSFRGKGLGRLAIILAISLGLIGFALGSRPAPVVVAAGNSCMTSGPTSNAYTVTVCLTSPTDGATVSGLQTVSATATTAGAAPAVAKLIYYLNGQYLLTDFKTPFSFVLPTAKWVDGSQILSVEALMNDGFVSQQASITLNFNNGVTTPPVNTNTFTPSSGTAPQAGQAFVMAAAGDGADGALYAGNVTSLISSWNPNLFLYLGDVYEKGSSAEFFNWYGMPGTLFGTFYPITDPVIGNHEYENGVAPGYFDYWNNIPSYYSYDAAGWHFIALNSNCGLLHICAAGQTEYQWLQNDLATHPNACTIAYYHHPVFNIGPEGYTTTMNDIWSLLAQYGVTLVLNGHDHDYQRWTPLDGNGNPSPNGITEFVVGSGGHGIQTFVAMDSRMVVGYDTSPNSFGALRMQLNPAGVGYQFINYQGTLLDSGTIPCHGTPPDTTSPTAPTNLAGVSNSSVQVDLSWISSTDNVGVAGYDIYRNGTFLTSVGAVNNYSDTNLTPGATYQYQIDARDGAGNTSSLSNTATISTPATLFSDGFESGNLSLWTGASNLMMQQQVVYDGSYAVRETSSGTTKTYATKTLSTTQTDLYYTTAFEIISKSSTTSAYLQRFRTSANGSILGVFITGNGKLGYRNFVNSTSNTNGPVVSAGFWHQVETHVRINGTSSLVEVWLDGAQVSALSQTISLGTTPIGILELGDSTASDVYDIALDDANASTSFISMTLSPTATNTPTFVPSPTNTPQFTPTATRTPANTPTNTPAPTFTPTTTNGSTATATSSSGLLFSDGFESGDLSLWTGSSNVVVQQQQVYSGLYAARATGTGTAASYAYKTLSAPQTNLYYSLWFKVLSQGSTSAYIQRFRTSTNSAIGGLLITSGGKLSYRNDVASSTVTSSTVVTQNVWHRLETHLSINGTSSLIEVWLDGAQITALSRTDNFGTSAIGRIHLGDFQGSDVYDMALDDVNVDTSFIQ